MDNIKQETQRKIILATEFDPEKYHLKKNWSGILYEVHLVNNGKYLTIDQQNFDEDDLGYFYITEDEYDLFRHNLKEIELQ